MKRKCGNFSYGFTKTTNYFSYNTDEVHDKYNINRHITDISKTSTKNLKHSKSAKHSDMKFHMRSI